MNRKLTIAAGLALLVLAPTAAMAHTDVSIGIGLGGYYPPVRVYAPPPPRVYYYETPTPYYYGPTVRYRYYGHDHDDWRYRHHDERWHHRHHDDDDDDD